MPSFSHRQRHKILEKLKVYPVHVRTLPGITDLVSGKATISDIREMDAGEPYSDSPESGVMTTAAELIPLASPDFESGPPRENAIELARVVDRGIRESEVIELDKLCIEPWEKVWIVFILNNHEIIFGKVFVENQF